MAKMRLFSGLTADLEIAVAKLLPLCSGSSFDLSCCSCLHPYRMPVADMIASDRGSDLEAC